MADKNRDAQASLQQQAMYRRVDNANRHNTGTKLYAETSVEIDRVNKALSEATRAASKYGSSFSGVTSHLKEQLSLLQEELSLLKETNKPELLKRAKEELEIQLKREAAEKRLAAADEQRKKYSLQAWKDTKAQYEQEKQSLIALEKERDKYSKSSTQYKAITEQISARKGIMGTLDSDLNHIYRTLSSSEKSTADYIKQKDNAATVTESIKTAVSASLHEFAEKDLSDKLSSVSNTLNSVIDGISPVINRIVDGAAQTVSQNYGSLNAALDGVTGELRDYNSINDELQSTLGLSSLVKQTDVLSSITGIAKQGITTDIESIGLLSTIADKTVASFNVTDYGLRRLIKLNQQKGNLTAKQFGLADALKESFNATFGDSSFLSSMYQNLTSTMLDAVSANAQNGGTDSTAFYSITEGWLGAMYEAGVDQGSINSIAQGINYLGSGNINALSGNKTLSNLLLLAADRAGLDYAQILQSGLSDGDVNSLLKEIVDYLAEITTNTTENNVLQSSYANLFNLSITDLTAIKNLSESNYSAQYITGTTALTNAVNEINNLSNRTTWAEQINNVIDNAKFSFGSSVADSGTYIMYKVSGLLLDIVGNLEDQIMSSGSNATLPFGMSANVANIGLNASVGNVLSAIKLGTGIAYLGSLLPGFVGLVSSLGTSLSSLGDSNNSLAQVIAASTGGGMYDNTSSSSGMLTSRGAKLKGFTLSDSMSSASSEFSDTSTWENDAQASMEEEGETTSILKKIEKALMQQKDNEDGGYAFAVSLQGMSDGVLRSFASIFADEDSMFETMTGKNNALEDNNTFIKYLEDSTTKN